MGDFRGERKTVDTTQDLSNFIGIDKCNFCKGKCAYANKHCKRISVMKQIH